MTKFERKYNNIAFERYMQLLIQNKNNVNTYEH